METYAGSVYVVVNCVAKVGMVKPVFTCDIWVCVEKLEVVEVDVDEVVDVVLEVRALMSV